MPETQLTELEQGAATTRVSNAIISSCLVQLPMLAQMSNAFKMEHTHDSILVPSYVGVENEQIVRKREADGSEVGSTDDYDHYKGQRHDIGFVPVSPSEPMKVELTIPERDMVAVARSNYMPEVARIKGHALAKDVSNEFFRAVSPAAGGPDFLGSVGTPNVPVNYPVATMDGNRLNDIQAALEVSDCDFPNLFLKNAYKHQLRKDAKLVPAENVANVQRDGRILQNLFEFNEMNIGFGRHFPDVNNKNLSGIAFDRFGIAVVTMPAPVVTTMGTDYIDANLITDGATGITMAYKMWHDPNTSTFRYTWELYTGFKLLSPDRVKLLRTADPA